ncbi:MAG: ATP-dependent RecD-like DNA helicase [Candidatus Eisenbacteria bacterium]
MTVNEGLFEEKQLEIKGEVKRITYRSEDGYTVLRLEAPGSGATCVGYFARIGPGDRIKAKGKWVAHPRYGRQFSVTTYQVIPPHTTEGIARYLASGLVKGVGEGIADRIVERFGEKTLEVIEKEPRRLLEVEGLGPKRVQAIKKAWREQREISELVVFLESHGIRVGSALKIHKQYGAASIDVIRENPYRLASEIWGIGFATADKIAYRLGVAPDAPVRVRAAIVYLLSEASVEGHVFLEERLLRAQCGSMLGIAETAFEDAVAVLAGESQIVQERERIYLPHLLEAEKSIVASLRRLYESEDRPALSSLDEVLARMENEQGRPFGDSQLSAIKRGLSSNPAIITGGPGTGKTTIVRAFVDVYESHGLKVCLAAPTGRAAKRMSEIAQSEAKTIHRLLEYSPQDGVFRRNAQNPIVADLVVVDEASMLDILLASALLKAIKPSTSVILVGDIDQLPPVGPGNFLRDVIEAGRFPVQRLTHIFRQEAGSTIVENAHRINEGEFPVFSKDSGDFFMIDEENPGEVANKVVELCSRKLPVGFGLDPVSDIQVLAPMYKGDAGAINLNARLQEALNPLGKRLEELRFRVGDKVMQLRNNYDKMVFNGDIGRVVDYDPDGDRLIIRFDADVEYDRSELDEVTLAYAITVHKSQGSEFPCVVLPVLTQHYIMLYRNLLYTAVTRAKSVVVLVGTRRAVGLAVRNIKTEQRFSSLAERLVEEIR